MRRGSKLGLVRAVWMVTMVAALWGCSPGGEERFEDHRHHVSELRPTDAEDPGGYEGAEVASLESPGGHLRVWYALEGEHQPPRADLNGSGIPDYVEMAAAIGDEVGEFLLQEGWRRPLVGQNLVQREVPLDLFLVSFSAGDGNYRPEYCGWNGENQVCSGHLRVESNFRTGYYPSQEYALRVVISHEFFHAVQYAYSAEMPPWWAEGSATWFQEYFWEEQNDFENLTGYFFAESERSLNDRQRGPFDGFAYGAALFVYFLELQIGTEGVREIHEVMGRGVGPEAAIEEALQARGMNLKEAFEVFVAWNGFTGSRAIGGEGYREGDRFGEVPMLSLDGGQAVNWNVEVDALAAVYGLIEGDRDITVELVEIEGRERAGLVAISVPEFEESGAIRWPVGEDAMVFRKEALPVVVAVVNTEISGRQAAQLRLRGARNDPGEEPQEVVGEEQGESERSGCSAVGEGPVPAGWIWVVMAVGVILVRGRRKGPGECR